MAPEQTEWAWGPGVHCLSPGHSLRPSAAAPPLRCPRTPVLLTSLKQVQHLQKHRREQGWVLIITFPLFLALAV